MDPHSFIARAEAQRWLGLAEKLLMNRDLVGCKTFAIRARESDPRLEPANQILAVADTLLAAEKRVGSTDQMMDWYSILQLVPLTQDSEMIDSQYRRLALLLNPNKNQLPYADQALQLVAEAWSMLSNPLRKSMYDSELNFQHHHQHQQQFNSVAFGEIPQMQPQPHHQQQQQQQQQYNFFSQPELPFDINPQHQPNQQQQQHNFLSQSNIIGLGLEPEQPVQRQPQPQPQQIRQPQSPPPAPPQQVPPQQEQPVERSVHVRGPQESSSNGVRVEEEREMNDAGDGQETSRFWTACPFCFYMYEYFSVYADCTIRCGNCQRAFQAVPVNSPPLLVTTSEGKDAYYYCWGFIPIGISKSTLMKDKGKGSSWAPFSPMFAENDVNVGMPRRS